MVFSKKHVFSLIFAINYIWESRATNLFDNRSLAIHPASTIFGNFTDRQRKQMDVSDTTIRLSIGLEHVDDLFEDIKNSL